jgi:F-type H+/Na+-transporting ATPase subunit alpha
LTELLKQHQYQPAAIWEQVVSISAVTNGYFDTVPAAQIKAAQSALLAKLGADHKKEMTELDKGGKPDEAMNKLIETTAHSVAKGFAG